MVRASLFLLGYRSLTVKEEDIRLICSELLRLGVSMQQISEKEVLVPERSLKLILSRIDGRYEYSISEPRGLLGMIKRTKYKRGICAGLVISLFLACFLQNLVWDIRIDGELKRSEAEIKEVLSSCGLEIGSRWHSLDRSEVESTVLAADAGISWININRRGTVAYVEIKEREGGDIESDENKQGYANIVATEGCVIEEITVRRGVAAVKPGDVVKKGDILISGIARDGSFCHADGVVLGRVSRRVEVNIPRYYQKEVSSVAHSQRADLKIFNFPINIFKKYGNSYSGCDIIEDVKVFSLFGVTLPLTVVTSSAIIPTFESAEYSDEELVFIASEELSKRVGDELSDADLLKIKTDGRFTEEGYLMYSDILMTRSVGKALEFYLD